MKLFTTKKGGLVDELIHYIPRIIYLILLLSFFYLLISYFQKSAFGGLPSVEQDIFFEHVLHSPALSYYDPFTGKQAAGIFGVDTFTTDRLEQSYKNFTKDKLVAAQVILYDIEKNQQKKVIYFDQKTYDRWIPLVKNSGKGSVIGKNKMTYVLYVENGELKKGWLYAYIIVPES